jgi:hypothetical protein
MCKMRSQNENARIWLQTLQQWILQIASITIRPWLLSRLCHPRPETNQTRQSHSLTSQNLTHLIFTICLSFTQYFIQLGQRL